jgi:predicted alpha-1,2-mannosidase
MPDQKSPADWVNPLIDTANRRFFFFSSACRPFGMVNLSPDTARSGAWEAGYRYDSGYIHDFSHVHAWQLAGIAVLPATGRVRGHEGSENFRSRFSHDDEIVAPGYHAVHLIDYDIHAELTATDRVGLHRYTFPETDDAHILFDLGTELGPCEMSDCHAEMVSDRRMTGFVETSATRRRPKATRIYFVADFDQPVAVFGGWRNEVLTESIDSVSGKESGAYVRFNLDDNRVVQMKIAISYCSIEGALRNLGAEAPDWNFDQVRQDATDVWNSWLGRIQVSGSTDDQKTKFYTDLYHAILGRRRISDVDGAYSDQTGDAQVIRQIPIQEDGSLAYEHHNSDAFWGSQWTLNVLWSLAYPDIMHNFCNTLIDMYKNGGLIPRGPSGGNYTFVMTSATSTHFLVSAYQKGIRNWDTAAGYEGLVKNHGPGGLMSKAGYEHDTSIGGGVEQYIELGYVPHGIKAKAFHCDGAAQTLEYAYVDWCLAEMARSLGHHEDAEKFGVRARNYRNLYDEDTGFLRPRHADGSWLENFDPMKPDGWNEGNGWQYLWHVPHDVAGLAELMGGYATMAERLDAVLTEAAEQDFIAPHSKHHLNVLDYGNQPSTHVAHLFNFIGKPWLAQKWIREIMQACKSDVTPYGGYGGDEDQGQMGALNVLMAMGLFEMRGGCEADPVYEITTPIFDRITIQLDPAYYGGSEIVVETNGSGTYIQSAELNGAPLDRCWFRHSDIVAGGRLSLQLGPEPNKEWGASEPPPSQSTEYPTGHPE